MGIPGAGKRRRRRGVRRPRVPAPQPRRARRLAARARRGARRGACVGRAEGRPRQHVPDSRVAELRGRGGEPARRRRRGASGSNTARAGAGQPRRADPRPGRRAPDARGAARAGARGGHATRRPRRCGRSESSSRRRPTRASPPWSASRSCGRRPPGAHGRLRRGRRTWWRTPPSEPGAPVLLFDWKPDGAVEELAEEAARLAAEASGPVETAICPHTRRPAGVLVPAAAAGAPARVRACPRRRPFTLDPRRNRPGASHAREDARRAKHRPVGGLLAKCERLARSSNR